MVIDIQPTERQPNDIERVIMKLYGYSELYYFMQDEKEHSVKWTQQSIQQFLPNWSVSEYAENHLVKYAGLFAHCMCAWEHEKHPFWTIEQVITDGIRTRRTGKQVPKPLIDKYEKNSAKYWLKNSYEQFNKPLTFVMVKL